MHPVLKQFVFISILLNSISPALHAQTNNPKFQLGIGAGTFIYQGDLTPSKLGSYRTMRPVVQLFASKFFSRFLALRGNIAIGGLKGDDAKYDSPEYRQQRNFAYRTPVMEITAMAEWNILGRNYRTKGLAPYLFAGAGASFLRVRRDWSNLNTSYFSAESQMMTGLSEDVQHRTPRVLPVVPVGIGLRYYLSDRVGISVETNYRLFSTDYLDGFSQAANPSRKDHYYSHTIGVVYRIGKKNMLDCPPALY